MNGTDFVATGVISGVVAAAGTSVATSDGAWSLAVGVLAAVAVPVVTLLAKWGLEPVGVVTTESVSARIASEHAESAARRAKKQPTVSNAELCECSSCSITFPRKVSKERLGYESEYTSYDECIPCSDEHSEIETFFHEVGRYDRAKARSEEMKRKASPYISAKTGAAPATKAASPPPVTSKPVVSEAERLDALWASTLATHDRLLDEWMTAERDIDKILETPALFDASNPVTSAFYLALDGARDARGSGEHRPVAAAAVESYAARVREASTAWAAAQRNARRVALSAFTPAEVKTVKRVHALLKQAMHAGTPEAERRTFYVSAREKLGTLIDLPAPAVAVIEQQVRGELAAAPPRPADVSILTPVTDELVPAQNP